MCEICSKLTMKISERRHLRSFGLFTVNFEQVSYIVHPSSLLILNKYMLDGQKGLNKIFQRSFQES